ncbi:Gamma-interferon-inducible lysosomal thiol reductase [Armadillidium vulgare]|nr:Gamma-interferon-inducible lysosomal thiol reductase [Armadillidium vulgare]
MLSFVITIIAFCFVHVNQGETDDPVNISVFYESLCPDSIRFFTAQLEPTYTELRSIMTVDTHAYGKASDVADTEGGYTFECQHGPDECYGNKVLACGQQYITNHNTFLEFNFCVMGAEDPPSSGEECANQVGASATDIITCANSTEGEFLLHEVGLVEAKLDPQLTYVPWIIINDEFTQENLDAAQEDLKTLVCNTYQGTPPAACSA